MLELELRPTFYFIFLVLFMQEIMIFEHNSLGMIVGIKGDGVIQFLGIKYASIEDRFAESKLLDEKPSAGVIDGTKLG